MGFIPDYRQLEMAARNQATRGIPLYEHLIDTGLMEAVLGRRFAQLVNGNDADLVEYFRQYCAFFQQSGYDAPCFEHCITTVLPGGGALGGHKKGVIQGWDDYERYPWDSLEERYFEQAGRLFAALRQALPPGMKAVGGVGNGLFECVQDLVGYEDLCFLRVDEPELYAQLFVRMGEVSLAIWKRFLKEYGDVFCVCRFGDDLGFKSETLLPHEDIKAHILPGYRRVVEAVHQAGKPFLLHSCGSIFGVMEELIAEVGIDAKHSNEDQIAPFPEWVARYGDRIGNFGGIDTDAVCRLGRAEMTEYIGDVVRQCHGHGGFAFGSGNSIPDYVPVSQFLLMNEIIRRARGEFT